MISDGLTNVLATMHDVEDPRRHALFEGEFREPNGSGRDALRRFRMMALPTAMAGASIQSGIMAGKLNRCGTDTQRSAVYALNPPSIIKLAPVM
jgi:hypothetical protein